MSFSRAWVVVPVLVLASTAHADPIAKSDPDKCPDAFTCGALAARLAGHDHDFAGALRAAKRHCDMSPEMGCEDLATTLIFAGPQAGDPPKGLAMLEALCKKPYLSACSTLAREYESPPKSSGLPRQPQKAEPLRAAGCARGDAMDCSALGEIYFAGGPGVPKDRVKARAALEKGCSGTDHYASGVCSQLAEKIVKGELGPPRVKEALPYLERSCGEHGYRCDLLTKLLIEGAPEEGLAPDEAKAKRLARATCNRSSRCPGVEAFETRDPAWAKAQYRELCDQGGRLSCDRLAWLNGTPAPHRSKR